MVAPRILRFHALALFIAIIAMLCACVEGGYHADTGNTQHRAETPWGGRNGTAVLAFLKAWAFHAPWQTAYAVTGTSRAWRLA